jgi:nucleoside-diphosphate-sugar epimerase
MLHASTADPYYKRQISRVNQVRVVSDEIEGILKLAWSSEHLPTNIGNPTEFTIQDCAKLVLKVTGSTSTIRFMPLPEDDPRQRRPDISKAQRLLEWQPTIDLENGLRLCLNYFQKEVCSHFGGVGEIAENAPARPR